MTPITPTWAAKVWLEGDRIFADLPMPEGPRRHTLCFPNDGQGLARLLYLIRHRSMESKIGEPGDITQHQLDIELVRKSKVPVKKGGIGFSSAARSTAKDILRKAGLI